VAAHELRTLTQAIIGYSDLFYLRPESIEEAIKAISRNAERLETLTRDILDVTRIEGHRLDLNKEKFDISEVVASAIEDTRRRVDDSNTKFEYTSRKVVVEADRMRISQVISNLQSNSIKFTKRGTVYISADNKDGQVIVSVKDMGAGIDPEMMSRLFTKFTQPNPRQARILDCSFLKALSKHTGVEFGLKTIRTEKVQHSPLGCLCKPDLYLQLHPLTL
jgi:two-component system, OmpR family, sensor histidine kinase VicK